MLLFLSARSARACSSSAERFSDKEEVEGSIPSTRTQMSIIFQGL